jgi:hypothetical protein
MSVAHHLTVSDSCKPTLVLSHLHFITDPKRIHESKGSFSVE